MVKYSKGFGAVYQTTNNVSSAYFSAVSAAQSSKQTVWGAGGTYTAGPAKLYLGYTDSELDVANAKNNVIYAGINYQLTPALQLIGTVQHDKLKRTAGDGTRLTSGLMLDYFLSKRTDVYIEVDHTKLKDGWIALANNAGLGAANVFGNGSRVGLMVGVRHKF
jgi:predicted porin